MSSRHPFYLTLVVVLALVFSAPQLIVGMQLSAEIFQRGWWALPPFPVFGQSTYVSSMSPAQFWNDHFYLVGYCKATMDGKIESKAIKIDPETGDSLITWTLNGPGDFQPYAFGNRLYLIGYSPNGMGDSYEVVENELVSHPMQNLPIYPSDGQTFEWNGELAFAMNLTGQGVNVAVSRAGKWMNLGRLAVPENNREWTIGGVQVKSMMPWNVQCYSYGDRQHVFVKLTSGGMLYRDRLEVEPDTSSLPMPFLGLATATASFTEPVSALKASNTDAVLEGWSIVYDPISTGGRNDQVSLHGMLIEGKPAALIVDGVSTGHAIGRILRFDGKSWLEFAKVEFPFGTNQFRSLPSHDAQRTILVATTSTGVTHVYAVEASGVRQTNYRSKEMNPMLNQIVGTFYIFLFRLMFGLALGLLLWFLMNCFTKPDYGYGLQHVKLASLGKRGAARLIDMGVVLASTGAFGWLITRKLDWLTLGEVINLRVDHPVIGQAVTAAALAVIWLVIMAISLLLTQAYWGTTPGKWLCGIRLLRTTLQPCGVARVIVREALFWWVDVVCLCWWIPGIAGIALSEKRQRLGDLAADTIVIAQSRQNSKATSETKESHANHGT